MSPAPRRAASLCFGMATSQLQDSRAQRQREEARHRISVGEDKAYDTADHVAALRELDVTPQVAQNNGPTKSGKRRRSAIDGRTTRHAGYAMSRSRRAMIECVFGLGKQHGTMRKTKHRGLVRAAGDFLLTLIAYNLVRLPKLIAASGGESARMAKIACRPAFPAAIDRKSGANPKQNWRRNETFASFSANRLCAMSLVEKSCLRAPPTQSRTLRSCGSAISSAVTTPGAEARGRSAQRGRATSYGRTGSAAVRAQAQDRPRHRSYSRRPADPCPRANTDTRDNSPPITQPPSRAPQSRAERLPQSDHTRISPRRIHEYPRDASRIGRVKPASA